MKKQLFNTLIVFLGLLVLFALYSTFGTTKEHSVKNKEEGPATYIEDDIYTKKTVIVDKYGDKSISVRRSMTDKKIPFRIKEQNHKSLPISYNTPEEMEEHTEDIYDTLLPDTHDGSLENANEIFASLDTHVSEVSEIMQEDKDIFSLNQDGTDEMYQVENDYEMELPVINE
jgi:hypothetical protein